MTRFAFSADPMPSRRRYAFEALEPRLFLNAGPLLLNEICAVNNGVLADADGDFSDWVEIHNPAETSVNLGGWIMTDDFDELDKWMFPPVTVEPGEYVIVFASGKDRLDPHAELHTNFSLSGEGEFLALIRPDGTLSHGYSPRFPAQYSDISYGVSPTGYAYFSTPTPGEENREAVQGFAEAPSFSHERGFYDAHFYLELGSETAGAAIRYTTDGTIPTATNGELYTDPIPVQYPTVVRAVSFGEDLLPSETVTHSFLFPDYVTKQSGTAMPTYWGDMPADYRLAADVYNDPAYKDDFDDALAALPTVSIVMDAANELFGPEGIYTNWSWDGPESERQTSIEWISPDGSEDGFQIDCGIRIHGGAARRQEKKSFRLYFRDEYGDGRLDYPIFEDSLVQSFDQLVLRGGYNDAYSWTLGTSAVQYTRDRFSRDSQLAMGSLSCDGEYAHVYINGLYWGVYDVCERIDSDFCADHLGIAEEWDILKHTQSATGAELADGDRVIWDRMMGLANAGLSSQANYEAMQEYVDVVNLADYMILNIYAGSWDWPHRNWYAARPRVDGGKFQFFMWDNECSLHHIDIRGVDQLTVNKVGADSADTPSRLYARLRANAEFRQLFADRVHKWFFDDGVLTPERCEARFDSLADEIRLPMIAESARWGDLRRSGDSYSPADWEIEHAAMDLIYFPQRTDIVLSQFRAAGLYPSTEAPVFNQHGGRVDEGFELNISAAAGEIYYTLDGSDPRLPGGEIDPEAQSTSAASDVLLSFGSDWKYLDDGTDQGSAWIAPAFDDSIWDFGPAKLGYGGDNEVTTVSYGPSESDKYITTYFRTTFSVDDPSEYTDLIVSMIRDDGAIVYLNGTEVLRSNLPDGPIAFDTPASGGIGSAIEQNVLTFTIDPARLLLGENTIAVEIHQVSHTSSDIGLDLALSASGAGDGSSILLNESTVVVARAYVGGSWSALTEAEFIVGVPASSENLAIVEINYHPYDACPGEPAVDEDEFEFIELQNVSDEIVQLAGVEFVEGIAFDFDTSTLGELQPGERLILVTNQAAFQARYGTDLLVAGVYEGRLSNSGERLVLRDAFGATIDDFEYGDSGAWPDRADGDGSSLVRINSAVGAADTQNWASSVAVGGTPGSESYNPPVVVNEILARTDPPMSDAIELYNRSDSPVEIGGWYLSDSSDALAKFQIPLGTILPAGEFIVFTEDDFGAPALPTGFALSGTDGDDVWLTRLDTNGNPTHFMDHAEFGATATGVSLGRYPDGFGPLAPMRVRSLGAQNGVPETPEVVISEVHYHPTDQMPTSLEYVELLNTTDAQVNLSGYRLADGIVYEFPAETVLGPRETLLVTAVDPSDGEALVDFYLHYAGSIEPGASLRLFGPFAGALNNAGERVTLLRRDESTGGDPAAMPMILVDEIDYNDALPWPDEADGDGMALHRASLSIWGTEPQAWTAAPPSLGATSVVFAIRGDLDADGKVGTADLDLVRANWGRTVPAGDLLQGDASSDGVVGTADLDLVRAHWGSTPAFAGASLAYGPRPRVAADAVFAQAGGDAAGFLRKLQEAAWLEELAGAKRRSGRR